MSRATFQPAYLRLFASGELQRRAEEAIAKLAACDLCPRACRVNRLESQTNVCKTGRLAVVSSAFPHHGEEDCLRGTRGSGTIFFSWCNLRCVFCQNFEISAQGEGRATTAEELAEAMLALQQRGCHNINLVTPSHVVAQVLEALVRAVAAGLRLPLVYNTGGYDSLQALALLEGVIDIYMPDFKFWSPEVARRYANAPDYPEVARAAIAEMHRQVGPLAFDEHGLALRGVLLRHLVLPADAAGTAAIMQWLARAVSPDTYVNVMAQYYPSGKVAGEDYPELARPITAGEFRHALHAALDAGLTRLDTRSARRLL
jgi:putative pyruvate formate lyase activating enzyme